LRRSPARREWRASLSRIANVGWRELVPASEADRTDSAVTEPTLFEKIALSASNP
jgi:hypothetical protein